MTDRHVLQPKVTGFAIAYTMVWRDGERTIGYILPGPRMIQQATIPKWLRRRIQSLVEKAAKEVEAPEL